MISVDLFVDLSGWSERDQARGRRMADAARGVRGATTMTGSSLFVDAALSVLDAIGSYARYRQAQEITHQLEIEGNRLRQMLAELHQQLGLELAAAKQRGETDLERLRLRLCEQRLAIDIDAEQFGHLSRQIKRMGQLVAQQRRSAPPRCTTLAELENTYYQMVDRQIELGLAMVRE